MRQRHAALLAAALSVTVAVMLPGYFRTGWPEVAPVGVIIGGIAALLLAMTPRLGPWLGARLDRLNALNAGERLRTAVGVGALSSAVLLALTKLMGMPLRLLWHDEFQFHLQSQLLARFRLWMPAHPISDFFDTFYVLMQPHYAPQSFPGAALLFAPTVWLHMPTWVMPLIVSGVACALLWWILAELVDPVCATVGWLALLCNWGFLRMSTMYLAQVPELMLGLAAFASMLVWQRTRSTRAAAMIGIALGAAAITRPLDAVCYGAVVAAGMLATLRTLPTARKARAIAVVVVAAMPFLALQGVFNVGITGSLLTTPFGFYNERDQPALASSHPDASRQPASVIVEKREFYNFSTMGFVGMYRDPRMRAGILWRIRFGEAPEWLAPSLIMLAFAMLGAAGLRTRQRWLLFAIGPLFVVAYQWYPIYHPHYVIFALPALVLLTALVPQVAQQLSERWGKMAYRAAGAFLIGISTGSLVQRAVSTPPDEMLRTRVSVEDALKAVIAPAIVLFSAPLRPEELHTEFVYNDNVRWPDDAPIIRAHSLGPRNRELFEYYARRQPNRDIWQFDRANGQLSRLGTARELGAAPPQK